MSQSLKLATSRRSLLITWWCDTDTGRCLCDAGQRPPIDREGFRKAIYTIDIGQNDVSAYMHLPYDQVLAKIPGFVAQIKYTIEVINKYKSLLFFLFSN
jgi:hypothetical protein